MSKGYYIPDGPKDPDTGLLFSTDPEFNEGFIDIVATQDISKEGWHQIDMAKYGYNMSREEAQGLYEFLGEALSQPEYVGE